jgi:hypothetical protein
MDIERVQRLLKTGQTPRQVSKELGYSRQEVQEFAEQLSSQQRRSTIRSILLPLFGLAAMALLAATAYYSLKEPSNAEVYGNVIKGAEGLTSPTQTGASWFLNTDQLPETEDAVKAEMSLISRLTARVNKALNDNSGIPEVKEEQDMFGGNLMSSVFTGSFGGTTRILTAGKGTFPTLKNLEVAFYSRHSLDHPRIGHRLLFYDSNWGSLIIAALNFSDDKWYDALLAHELWHAKRHREGAASATAPMLSDIWIDEELQAHDVETKVLDARTNGAYRQRLHGIASRISARSEKHFLAKITPEDLRQLDQLFNPGIAEERNIRAAQYFINLATTWLEIKYSGEKLRQKKIGVYRLMIDPTKSTNVQ